MKTCSKCGESKSIDEFHRDINSKNGHVNHCKECQKKRGRIYYEKNKEKILKSTREWKETNREKYKSILHEWYIKNKSSHLENSKEWREKNKQSLKKYHKEYHKLNAKEKIDSARKWKKENPDKVKINNKKANDKRRSTLKGALSDRISTLMRLSLKNGSKQGRHWETLVGYSLEDLKRHLEKQFKPGMSWENQGSWHIDHEIPISAFNFTSPDHEDFKRCWALKNLRPLWAEENIRKSNKLTKHFQPSLAI